MYYRLMEPWAFRGFKRLPYAIRAEQGDDMFKRPYFFGKEEFLDLLYCNGSENVDINELPEKSRRIFEEFLHHGLLTSSEEPMEPLSPWQRYHVYPSKYLESVHWSITGRCNFKCRHCLVSAPDNHHPEPTLDECMDIIRQIAQCGIHQVDITGGEPLVRRDCEAIFKALAEHHIFIRVFFTNASLLNEQVLDTLHKYGHCPAFQLSFDGKGHHDWLRGVKGAEEQADAAFKLLKKRGYRVSAAMCIHRENRDSLRETVKYLAENGVLALRLNAPQELGLWKQYSDEYAMTKQEVWDTYREYIPHYFEDGMPLDLELDGFFSCKKGSVDYKVSYVHHAPADSDWSKFAYCESTQYNAYISPEGRLLPCMGFSDTAIGKDFPSVFEKSMGELTLDSYYADVVRTKISDLLAKDKECAECPNLPICCGGCMLESMTEEGDYLVRDEKICWFFKNVGEAAVREVADAAIAKFQPDAPQKADTEETVKSDG